MQNVENQIESNKTKEKKIRQKEEEDKEKKEMKPKENVYIKTKINQHKTKESEG